MRHDGGRFHDGLDDRNTVGQARCTLGRRSWGSLSALSGQLGTLQGSFPAIHYRQCTGSSLPFQTWTCRFIRAILEEEDGAEAGAASQSVQELKPQTRPSQFIHRDSRSLSLKPFRRKRKTARQQRVSVRVPCRFGRCGTRRSFWGWGTYSTFRLDRRRLVWMSAQTWVLQKKPKWLLPPVQLAATSLSVKRQLLVPSLTLGTETGT
jgi:hypothetical protein